MSPRVTILSTLIIQTRYLISFLPYLQEQAEVGARRGVEAGDEAAEAGQHRGHPHRRGGRHAAGPGGPAQPRPRGRGRAEGGRGGGGGRELPAAQRDQFPGAAAAAAGGGI